MGAVCPYCRTELGPGAPIASLCLSERQARIYDAVRAAGIRGISTKDLIEKIFGKDPTKGSGVMLRVQIHEINRVLSPLNYRIEARRRRGYFLVQWR